MRHESVILRQSAMTPSPILMPMPICYARVIAHGLGLDDAGCAQLLLGSGLAPQDLDDANAYVSFNQQRAIVCNALRISGDPGIGLQLGALTPLSTHGALGLAAVSSRDLGAALDIFARYSATRAGFFRLDVAPRGHTLALVVHELTDLGAVRHFMHEILTLTLQALLHTVLGPQLDNVKLEFGYPAPAWRRAYARAFQMPLQFGASNTAMHIPLALLKRRCITADRKAAELAEQQCVRELAVLQQRTSFSATVRQTLEHHLEQGGAMVDVARSLRVSTRSLVRKLEREGTSFRQILEQLRRASAESYLRDSTHSIAEIAAALGYSDPSNLGRAFRGWHGMSPSAYRERQGAGGQWAEESGIVDRK